MQSARLHPVARALALACNQLHQAGLAPGTSGQFSVWDDDLLWLTPPGLSFRNLQPEHLLLIGPNGRQLGSEPQTNQQELANRLALHQAVYRARPEAKALLIANPPHAGNAAARYRSSSSAGQTGVSTVAGHPSFTLQWTPPQTDETRLDIAAVVFSTVAALLEPDFGLLVTGNGITHAQDRLEHLEAWLAAQAIPG